MAREKFFLIEERAEYPRCRYRWMHDKEELKPRYIMCDNGEEMWDEKKRCYYLTEKAPKQAYESFMAYILYEKKKGRLQDNSPYDVYGIIIKNY